MKLLNVLFFSFIVLSSWSCKKITKQLVEQIRFDITNDSKTLPENSQSGNNVFGFMLNNSVVWIAQRPLLTPRLNLSYKPSIKSGSMAIDVGRHPPSSLYYQHLIITCHNINSIGTYALSKGEATVSYNDPSTCYYNSETSDATLSGILIISRLDTVKKIISGTFDFKAEKIGCSAINATDGRFDMIYQ